MYISGFDYSASGRELLANTAIWGTIAIQYYQAGVGLQQTLSKVLRIVLSNEDKLPQAFTGSRAYSLTELFVPDMAAKIQDRLLRSYNKLVKPVGDTIVQSTPI